LSSNIENDNLDNQQDVLHRDQARRDKTRWTTRVPLPNQQSHTDTVIPCTALPNLAHPAGAIALPLLKLPKSTINILHKSDVVPAQAVLVPKAGGD
jgi:hypothetical protein